MKRNGWYGNQEVVVEILSMLNDSENQLRFFNDEKFTSEVGDFDR